MQVGVPAERVRFTVGGITGLSVTMMVSVPVLVSPEDAVPVSVTEKVPARPSIESTVTRISFEQVGIIDAHTRAVFGESVTYDTVLPLALFTGWLEVIVTSFDTPLDASAEIDTVADDPFWRVIVLSGTLKVIGSELIGRVMPEQVGDAAATDWAESLTVKTGADALDPTVAIGVLKSDDSE